MRVSVPMVPSRYRSGLGPSRTPQTGACPRLCSSGLIADPNVAFAASLLPLTTCAALSSHFNRRGMPTGEGCQPARDANRRGMPTGEGCLVRCQSLPNHSAESSSAAVSRSGGNSSVERAQRCPLYEETRHKSSERMIESPREGDVRGGEIFPARDLPFRPGHEL